MMGTEPFSTHFLNILLLGGILFVGLFNIVIYYVRKLLKAYFYFGLICVFYFIWYGYMELLQSDPTIHLTHKNYITKSFVRLLQMEKLTVDLFTLTQINDKSFTIHLEQINMVQMVWQVAELYAEQAHQKAIKINVETDTEAWCIADKMRLMQVLDNLLMNALAYARLSITISVTIHDGEVKVTVSDDGSRIHPDELPHVFDRYYKRRKRGSGIGLNIVKELIHRMHGKVAVESVPTAGASFMFTLPLQKTEQHAARATSKQ